jgi:hypothetical protein
MSYTAAVLKVRGLYLLPAHSVPFPCVLNDMGGTRHQHENHGRVLNSKYIKFPT